MKKITLLFLIILSSQIGLSQKANSKSQALTAQILNFPSNERLTTKEYGFILTEAASCEGLILPRTITTPIAVDERGKFIHNLIGIHQGFFYEGRNTIQNFIAAEKPLTVFHIDVDDIWLKNQTTENKMGSLDATAGTFYYTFEITVPIRLKAERVGDISQIVVDTTAQAMSSRVVRFPQDFRFLKTAADAKPDGYGSKNELRNAFNNYRKFAMKQWRDEEMQRFLSDFFNWYMLNYIEHKAYQRFSFYTDKNKKGGYENIVEAANYLELAYEVMGQNFENKLYCKQWCSDVQVKIEPAYEIYKSFMESIGFEVFTDDSNMKASYKQEMLSNYVLSLLLTGRFQECTQLIQKYKTMNILGKVKLDFIRWEGIALHWEKEFMARGEGFDWVRYSE